MRSMDTQTVEAPMENVCGVTPRAPRARFSTFLMSLFYWQQALSVWAQSIGDSRSGCGQNLDFCKNKFPLQSVTNGSITPN